MVERLAVPSVKRDLTYCMNLVQASRRGLVQCRTWMHWHSRKEKEPYVLTFASKLLLLLTIRCKQTTDKPWSCRSKPCYLTDDQMNREK